MQLGVVVVDDGGTVAALQRMGLLLSPAQHQKHHRTHASDFCIVTGHTDALVNLLYRNGLCRLFAFAAKFFSRSSWRYYLSTASNCSLVVPSGCVALMLGTPSSIKTVTMCGILFSVNASRPKPPRCVSAFPIVPWKLS